MKIVHTPTGKAYQLHPGTRLEIERPNLFFNEYGEQSLPVDLPDSDLNRELTGYPDLLANIQKPKADIDCTIQDGDYCMPCRQAILGAKRKEKITTSFYMNEGSFLSRIRKVALPEIFGGETVPGITTVQQGIDWCWSLRTNQDPHFACFPICVDIDGAKRGVNIICEMTSSGELPSGFDSDHFLHWSYGFYNAYERTEEVEGQIISLSPGYYITPFLRAGYLLQRIFSYFGYTLQENFFSITEPFASMAFVSNTADALVNGTIQLAHLVPDCLCSDILDLFRKKFCCEFIPDEANRTVSIVLFKDIIEAGSSIDLTPYLVAHPEIAFQEPRQLRLSSENSLTAGPVIESTSELVTKYPTAYYDEVFGSYRRFRYTTRRTLEVVSDGNLPFYTATEGFEDYEVIVPDIQPYSHTFLLCTSRYGFKLFATGLYIGEGRMLNSTIHSGNDLQDEDSEQEKMSYASEEHKQLPCLAFTTAGTDYTFGSCHNFPAGYSLHYNGPVGIYEKFWRPFDNLLRNALNEVSATMLLPTQLKQSLSVHHKVTLRGTDCLVNTLKYAIGGKNEPMESSLFTAQLRHPITMAPSETDRFPGTPTYVWSVSGNRTNLSEEQWVAAGYQVQTEVHTPAIYLPEPTQQQYDAGGRYHKRTVYYSYSNTASDGSVEYVYVRHDLYFTPVLYSFDIPESNLS